MSKTVFIKRIKGLAALLLAVIMLAEAPGLVSLAVDHGDYTLWTDIEVVDGGEKLLVINSDAIKDDAFAPGDTVTLRNVSTFSGYYLLYDTTYEANTFPTDIYDPGENNQGASIDSFDTVTMPTPAGGSNYVWKYNNILTTDRETNTNGWVCFTPSPAYAITTGTGVSVTQINGEAAPETLPGLYEPGTSVSFRTDADFDGFWFVLKGGEEDGIGQVDTAFDGLNIGKTFDVEMPAYGIQVRYERYYDCSESQNGLINDVTARSFSLPSQGSVIIKVASGKSVMANFGDSTGTVNRIGDDGTVTYYEITAPTAPETADTNAVWVLNQVFTTEADLTCKFGQGYQIPIEIDTNQLAITGGAYKESNQYYVYTGGSMFVKPKAASDSKTVVARTNDGTVIEMNGPDSDGKYEIPIATELKDSTKLSLSYQDIRTISYDIEFIKVAVQNSVFTNPDQMPQSPQNACAGDTICLEMGAYDWPTTKVEIRDAEGALLEVFRNNESEQTSFTMPDKDITVDLVPYTTIWWEEDILKYFDITKDGSKVVPKTGNENDRVPTEIVAGDELTLKRKQDGNIPDRFYIYRLSTDGKKYQEAVIAGEETYTYTVSSVETSDILPEAEQLYTIEVVGGKAEMDFVDENQASQAGMSKEDLNKKFFGYFHGDYEWNIIWEEDLYGAELSGWEVTDQAGNNALDDSEIGQLWSTDSAIAPNLSCMINPVYAGERSSKFTFKAINSYAVNTPKEEKFTITDSNKKEITTALPNMDIYITAPQKPDLVCTGILVQKQDGEGTFSPAADVTVEVGENNTWIFNMPAYSVYVTAEYKASVSAQDGLILTDYDTGEQYTEGRILPGRKVLISTAEGVFPVGSKPVYTGTYTTSDAVTPISFVEDAKGTYFVMPEAFALISVDYLTYRLQLTNCTMEGTEGSEVYVKAGEEVSLTAKIPEGYGYDADTGWEVSTPQDTNGDEIIDNPTVSDDEMSLSFTMKGYSLEVRVNCLPLYRLTAEGLGETYTFDLFEGDSIELVAEDRPRQEFVQWLITKTTGEDVTKTLLTDSYNSLLSFAMPGFDIKIQAMYGEEHEESGAVMTPGKALKLVKGIPYKLAEGKIWKVSGDTTKYYGGVTFYVGEDSQLTFEEE